MNTKTLIFLIIISIILFYIVYKLLSLLIVKYFKFQKNRCSKKSSFISKYAILILYLAFCYVNPTISENILNWCIIILNKQFNLNIPTYTIQLDNYSIAIYLVLSLSICYILYQTFNKKNKKHIKQRFIYNDYRNKEIKEIQFPKNTFSESPHLRLRLKKYFELKYQKFNLKLNNSIKDEILYGSYQDGLREFSIFISYSEKNINQVTQKNEIEKTKDKLEYFSKELILKENYNSSFIDLYYIISNGKFEKHNKKNIITQTEDDILNNLIDFNGYLKSIVENYNHDKLFSAVAKEKDKKTLAETFISPPFSIGEQKEVQTSKLEDNINSWLLNSPESKHLALLGDYGMGKTSFLRHYSETLATDILVQKKIIRFPVLISLTNSSPRHGGIEEKIKAFVAENIGVDYALFNILIHKGKILFLLDGFDEMGFVGTHEDRYKQMNEIWQLAHKNNKLIISGRPSYFTSKYELEKTLNIVKKDDQIIQTNPYCESINLSLLNEEQIQDYIKKYHPLKGEEYFNWITQFPSFLELCKRPSMMHIIREMLPNLYRNEVTNIQTHGGAINKYINYWINRQESKNIQSAFSENIKKITFVKDFFSELAIDLFSAKQYYLTSDYVLKKLKSHIEKADIKKFEADYQKEGFENEILTCYFIELDDGFYRFVHKSFFEYFVAQEIIKKISKGKFSSNILFDEWSNSIVNFIYDDIPENLKNNKSIPALLLLTNKKWLGNIKSKIFKFLLVNSESIYAIGTLLIIITSIFFYFFYFFIKVICA
ncbi:NACHT domain-containing protein, partial [Lacinutrix sp.]|uniref:NACHT domain-containing protein n=1 Tax=Lacinutrix sp. TaxID=1937692 RepID=UPI0025BEB269